MTTGLEQDGGLDTATQEAVHLLEQGNAKQAIARLKEALSGCEGSKSAWVVLSRAQQRISDFAAMAQSAKRARLLAPQEEAVQDLEIEALILRGDIPAARGRIIDLSGASKTSAKRLDRLSQFATQIADYSLAEQLLEQAHELGAEGPGYRFNLAAAQVALGKLDEAESNLVAVTREAKFDGDAHYNLATLRRAHPDRNHVAELRKIIAEAKGRRDAYALHFALAKELEDLGLHAESFDALKAGNRLRRAAMRYRVEEDVQTMDQVAAIHAHSLDGGSGYREAAPVFVVGMPRSGTTLVDRLLASHPAMQSVGEVNDLALAIMEETPAVRTKTELVEASAKTAPAAIGANYARRMRWRVPSSRRTVDKTPLNFLYLGIIARALPDARVVHVRRDPMDVAFAVYKTLFRMGYPFAYSLEDIGRYIIAKTRLMAHWSQVLAERIVHIDYEALVHDPSGQSRLLLEAAGLEWDDRVLEFYNDRSPTATASAAQVRKPIHTGSVGNWKRHREELAYLEKMLRSAGVID